MSAPAMSRWIIALPDGAEIDVIFCPAVDEAEARARYPEVRVIRSAPLPADRPEAETEAETLAPTRQTLERIQRWILAMGRGWDESAAQSIMQSCIEDPETLQFWVTEVDLAARLIQAHQDVLPTDRSHGWVERAIPKAVWDATTRSVLPEVWVNLDPEVQEVVEIAYRLRPALSSEAARWLLLAAYNPLARRLMLDALRQRPYPDWDEIIIKHIPRWRKIEAELAEA